ncbi:MAG TPA: hypothetical protein VLD67_02565 [Vicinamibacterales bacterium]|nr:hypothetical protein [Vicinamibacterales bacterium]
MTIADLDDGGLPHRTLREGVGNLPTDARAVGVPAPATEVLAPIRELPPVGAQHCADGDCFALVVGRSS